MALCTWAFLHFMLFYAYCNFLTVHASVLKFHVWIPYGKIADTFYLSSRLCPFPELWPFEKIWIKSFQQNISKTIEARALKFDG